MATTDDTISLAEALAELGISRTTLYKRIEEGKLTPLPRSTAAKKRARVEFLRADVERLKNEGL